MLQPLMLRLTRATSWQCCRFRRSQTHFALQAIVGLFVNYCRTYVKAVRGGGSEERGRVLWPGDASLLYRRSRGLCGRVGNAVTLRWFCRILNLK